ncbi:natural resistance-associated macrophage protein-domain-containing protein [Irpex rosettiformis]|uniref:Natural resistance-associated macrophage protein-domain-containing protein n=1 Tax=Irpex rosettiformis TaxID=378272 RepID=A0ACB8UHU3_9APHY|nr:natural resistance-associated macrophage protein-domain-containing protein [Irpex rosettiformis]
MDPSHDVIREGGAPGEPTQGTQGIKGGLGRRFNTSFKTIINHAVKHTGVGIVCAVAYFDPGNWGVDLQAGSEFGYKLLFVVLLSGIFAVFLQILASRLGCVTGLDLASHCRLLLHSRRKHTLIYRWVLLYPLYVLSEAAIIATDLAELLGSAIALCLLFPRLPLWGGVLITASDVLILLALKDPLGGRPVRMFEILIGILVFTVLVCMAVIIAQVGVNWGDAFDGYIPSKTLFQSGGLYTSIGIIGATVMPHSIFLGSALATQDRVSPTPDKLVQTDSTSTVDQSINSSSTSTTSRFGIKKTLISYISDLKERFISIFRVDSLQGKMELRSHAEHENNSYAFVRAHVYHGMIDIAISLLGLAVVINSLILILASAVFHYGAGKDSQGPASLFDAYALLKQIVGQGAATCFALALLASGQSASIVATMAGQTVSEGFLRWRISPIMRRVITRSLGLIPSMVVAIAIGRNGVDALLVASQVALSIVLPFIIFPLLYLTASKEVMTVMKPRIPPSVESDKSQERGDGGDIEIAMETVDFSNHRIVVVIGWLLWLVIVAANVYAIVSLGLGEG